VLGFKLARRVAAAVVLLVAGYLAITAVQVWLASRRDQAKSADAIVVLGAAQFNGHPSAVLRARLDHAADLYAQHLADVVFVTGGKQPGDTATATEASVSADYLAAHGVPQSSVLRENQGRNSWNSLAAAARILKDRGKRNVILVSDPFHSARIAAMASELGLKPLVSPTRTSPITGLSSDRYMVKEALEVSVGRIVGFRRLMGIDDRVVRARQGPANG
jgi:uncharacterized SAM-binding protein YcdF (DUF218 family)